MSDPVTQAQFYERMAMFDQKLQEYHRNSREHIDEQTDRLLEVFAAHEKEDREIVTRVTIIETERGIEKKEASKHGAIAGSLGAGLVLGLVEAVKRMLGPHP